MLTEVFLVTRYANVDSQKLIRSCTYFLVLHIGNPETNGVMTRSKTRINPVERTEEERECERQETQRLRHFWDEAPALEDARDDPFISAGSDEEDERRLVDFFAPYTQVPLPATSSESEGEEVVQQQQQRRNLTPPCSPNPSRCSHVTHATTIGRGVKVQGKQRPEPGAGARVSSCCISHPATKATSD